MKTFETTDQARQLDCTFELVSYDEDLTFLTITDPFGVEIPIL